MSFLGRFHNTDLVTNVVHKLKKKKKKMIRVFFTRAVIPHTLAAPEPQVLRMRERAGRGAATASPGEGSQTLVGIRITRRAC